MKIIKVNTVFSSAIPAYIQLPINDEVNLMDRIIKIGYMFIDISDAISNPVFEIIYLFLVVVFLSFKPVGIVICL
ncbi:MAG: hypothetical protein IKF80_07815 [Erysipelotrichaceae bacterium]|nr:hypothetical protein [Erysipelotrichaceae bacterium]